MRSITSSMDGHQFQVQTGVGAKVLNIGSTPPQIHVYWLTRTFLLKSLRSKLLSWQFSRSSPRGWTGRQGRAAWIKTPSKHGSRGPFEKIKSYLEEGGVGQHLGDLLSIVAFIQEIQLQWNVLLRFLHQPRKCKVWEQPMNHLHQHLEVTWKPAFIQSVCSGVYNESDNDAHNIFPKSARTTSELMKQSWHEVVVSQFKTTLMFLKTVQLDSKHRAHTPTASTTTSQVLIWSCAPCFADPSVHSPPSPLCLWCSGAEL